MKIYYFKPYSTEGNLGKAYNDSMTLLPNDNDWGVLMDGDVMFLTPDYGKQIEEVIKANPGVGIFTCVTNRVGNKQQCFEGMLSNNGDIRYHRMLAKILQEEGYSRLTECTRVISGHIMIVQKKTWKEFKFKEGQQILGIDTEFSRKVLMANKKIMCMAGVYVFHYYRLCEGQSNKTHLTDAKYLSNNKRPDQNKQPATAL